LRLLNQQGPAVNTGKNKEISNQMRQPQELAILSTKPEKQSMLEIPDVQQVLYSEV